VGGFCLRISRRVGLEPRERGSERRAREEKHLIGRQSNLSSSAGIVSLANYDIPFSSHLFRLVSVISSQPRTPSAEAQPSSFEFQTTPPRRWTRPSGSSQTIARKRPSERSGMRPTRMGCRQEGNSRRTLDPRLVVIVGTRYTWTARLRGVMVGERVRMRAGVVAVGEGAVEVMQLLFLQERAVEVEHPRGTSPGPGSESRLPRTSRNGSS
jgi:hypothetical protein